MNIPANDQVGFPGNHENEIIQLKKAEAELELTISLLEATIESTADAILVTNTTGTIVKYNKKFSEFWQIPDEILETKDENLALQYVLQKLKYPDAFIKKVKELDSLPDAISNDLIELKDGRIFDRQSYPQLIKGKYVGRVWSFRDITELKKNIRNLRESEELLNQIGQIAKVGGWTLDLISHELIWTKETYVMADADFDYQPLEALALEYYHPNDRPVIQQLIESVIRSGKPMETEVRAISLKGREFWVHTIVYPIIEKGTVIKLLGAVQDITEKRELENNLLKEKIEKQKAITEMAIQIQEKEKSILGQELHDNINQMLAAAKMSLDLLKSKQTVSDKLLDFSYSCIENAVTEIRRLSHSLVTPTLGENGLIDSIHELIEGQKTSSGLEFNLINQLDLQLVEENKKLMCYRIIQEQLNNITKYAAAKKVIIRLLTKNNQLQLSITDDGKGFDTSQKVKGIGLKNILNRIKFYAGEMNIISSPGNGCQLNITVPIP